MFLPIQGLLHHAKTKVSSEQQVVYCTHKQCRHEIFIRYFLLLLEDENEIELPDTIRTGHAPIQRQYMLPNTPTPKVFVDKNFRFVPGHVT